MIVNEDRFFLSHRKDIALSAQREGWNIIIVCKDTGRRKEVEALGLTMIELPINPTGTNLKEELRTFWFLLRLYRRHQPDIVHHVGLKNILWGGLAAKLASVKGVVNAVSGLGILFSDEHFGLRGKAVLSVMKFSNHRKNVALIFQNMEDTNLFLQRGIAVQSQCNFTKGSGVNLDEYCYTPEPATLPIRIIFTARMVKEKGIYTFIQAAEQLRKEMEDKACFLLCGGLSNNPDGIKGDELMGLCDGKYIQWMGFRSDVKELLMESHIMVLPSYYREGIPRSLIEACAIGRPIVTTNSIGCKDTVDDGVNGFLIPIKDSVALADKLRILIDNKTLRCTMGQASRLKAEKEFSLEKVVSKHMEIYRQLSGETPPVTSPVSS